MWESVTVSPPSEGPSAGKGFSRQQECLQLGLGGWWEEEEKQREAVGGSDFQANNLMAEIPVWLWKDWDQSGLRAHLGYRHITVKELQSTTGRGQWINDAPEAAAAAKSLQSCPTLCDPIGGSPPGSAVPGILQARTLEWAAISFSKAALCTSHDPQKTHTITRSFHGSCWGTPRPVVIFSLLSLYTCHEWSHLFPSFVTFFSFLNGYWIFLVSCL